MARSSLNTDMGAVVALQPLNRTSDAPQSTRERISTGTWVSDARDDGVGFAIVQTVRSGVASLSTANSQFDGVQGLPTTTAKALGTGERVSGEAIRMRELLVNLSDTTLDDENRETYSDDFNKMVRKTNFILSSATRNGRSMIANDENVEGLSIAGTVGATLTFDTAINISTGDVATGTPGADFAPEPSGLPASSVMTAPRAQALLGSGLVADSPNVRASDGGTPAAMRTFAEVQTAVNDALSEFGGAVNHISSRIDLDEAELDAMEGGLGALIDADLAEESARLQALQIRQQLGTQSLGIANQAPQALLSLFRG